MSEQTIELDCPPGSPRPGDLIEAVIEGTGLPLKETSGRCFGNWSWDYSDIPADQWEKVRPVLKERVTALYTDELRRLDERKDESAETQRKEWSDYLVGLGQSACLSYQELSLRPTSLGWIITVFGCNEDGQVKILIPKNRDRPVKVLCDTRKSSKAYERY